jgi:hypothetical protein
LQLPAFPSIAIPRIRERSCRIPHKMSSNRTQIMLEVTLPSGLPDRI